MVLDSAHPEIAVYALAQSAFRIQQTRWTGGSKADRRSRAAPSENLGFTYEN
jgi:hypothetical protein